MELLAAKKDEYLPGFSYLDTQRSINPIVVRLQINLQEKWLSAGSQYKEQYRVCFLPFVFLLTLSTVRPRPEWSKFCFEE